MITASLFLHWVAAAKALSEFTHLGCWVSKQVNATSTALNNLLADEETTRHTMLQNIAAINFLLLSRGHSCQDFARMCCFNLSSHSKSIHVSTQRLEELVENTKIKKGADRPTGL